MTPCVVRLRCRAPPPPAWPLTPPFILLPLVPAVTFPLAWFWCEEPKVFLRYQSLRPINHTSTAHHSFCSHHHTESKFHALELNFSDFNRPKSVCIALESAIPAGSVQPLNLLQTLNHIFYLDTAALVLKTLNITSVVNYTHISQNHSGLLHCYVYWTLCS